jgi:hypothetical protein
MQGKKHYAEKLFTSFQLSSHVPRDNFFCFWLVRWMAAVH